jgi:hypothetical protein
VLLHHREELDDDLRARSNEDLTLSRLLGIVDGVEAIVEHRGSNHCDSLCKILNGNDATEVSVAPSPLAFSVKLEGAPDVKIERVLQLLPGGNVLIVLLKSNSTFRLAEWERRVILTYLRKMVVVRSVVCESCLSEEKIVEPFRF